MRCTRSSWLSCYGRVRPEGRRPIAVAATVATAFVALYSPVLAAIGRQWAADSMDSFGILVPIVSGYLVWDGRRSLAAARVRPQILLGTLLACVAGALLAAGRVTSIVGLQELSLVLMLAALTLLVLGHRHLSALALPMAYLFLMLPLRELATPHLHYAFQRFSASTALSILDAWGVPVYGDVTRIELPAVTLEVAAACSGVNSVWAVIALAIPAACVFVDGRLRRLLLVLCASGVALVSNGVRIAIIGVLADQRLGFGLHGPGHLLTGLFVSSVGTLALFAGVAVLAHYHPRRRNDPPPEPEAANARTGGRVTLAGGLALAVMSASAAAGDRPRVVGPQPLHSAIAVPVGWRPVTPAVTSVCSTGQPEGSRWQFQVGEAARVDLIVYAVVEYGSAGQVRYRVVDAPARTRRVSLEAADGRSVAAATASFRVGPRSCDVVYWYDLDRFTTPNAWLAKAYAAGAIVSRWPLPRTVWVARESDPGEEGSASEVLTIARQISGARRHAGPPRSLTDPAPNER